jgi:hypothetical protein
MASQRTNGKSGAGAGAGAGGSGTGSGSGDVALTEMQISIVLSTAKAIGTELVKRIAAHPDVREAGITEAQLMAAAGLTEMTVSKKAAGSGSRGHTYDPASTQPFPQLPHFPYIPDMTWGTCKSLVSNGNMITQCLDPKNEGDYCIKCGKPTCGNLTKLGSIEDRHESYHAKRRSDPSHALEYEHRVGRTKTTPKQYTLANHIPSLALKWKMTEGQVKKRYMDEAARLSTLLGRPVVIPEREFTAVSVNSRSATTAAAGSTSRTARGSPLTGAEREAAIAEVGDLQELADKLRKDEPKGAKLKMVYDAFRKVYMPDAKKETLVGPIRKQMLEHITSMDGDDDTGANEEEAADEAPVHRTVATRRTPVTRASTRPSSTTSEATVKAFVIKGKTYMWHADIERFKDEDGDIVPVSELPYKALIKEGKWTAPKLTDREKALMHEMDVRRAAAAAPDVEADEEDEEEEDGDDAASVGHAPDAEAGGDELDFGED